MGTFAGWEAEIVPKGRNVYTPRFQPGETGTIKIPAPTGRYFRGIVSPRWGMCLYQEFTTPSRSDGSSDFQAEFSKLRFFLLTGRWKYPTIRQFYFKISITERDFR